VGGREEKKRKEDWEERRRRVAEVEKARKMLKKGERQIPYTTPL